MDTRTQFIISVSEALKDIPPHEAYALFMDVLKQHCITAITQSEHNSPLNSDRD